MTVSVTEWWQSVRLHAQWSRATVKAQLGHLIGLLSSSQYTSAEGESIYCPTTLSSSLMCSVQLVAIGPSVGEPNKIENKLASGWQIPCWTVKTWTTLQRCTLCSYALLLVQIRCRLPLGLMGFLFSSQLSSTNLCCWVPGQSCRGNHRTCTDCVGQSDSGRGVNMQE